jgi:hypothetical protein
MGEAAGRTVELKPTLAAFGGAVHPPSMAADQFIAASSVINARGAMSATADQFAGADGR